MQRVPIVPDMFRPPLNHAMRVLDRSFFRKSVPLAAASVLENDQISRCRSELGHNILQVDHIRSIRPDPGDDDGKRPGRKALLLEPSIRPEDSSTWSTKLKELIQKQMVVVTPYELTLTYDMWTYRIYIWKPRIVLRLLRLNWV